MPLFCSRPEVGWKFFPLLKDLWSFARQELSLSTRQAELAKVELFNIEEYRKEPLSDTSLLRLE